MKREGTFCGKEAMKTSRFLLEENEATSVEA
jgi:hypothetical protein